MPVINVSNTSIVEGDGSYQYLDFIVTVDTVPTVPVTFYYYTQDGTASGLGGDYDESWNTVTIPAGTQTTTIRIPIYGDTRIEGNESLQLVVIPGTNATLPQGAPAMIATGTIYDNDDTIVDPVPGPGSPATLLFGETTNGALPTISVRDVSVIEGNSSYDNARFLVMLDRPATADVTFSYYIADGTASGANGDYDGPTHGVITIPAGRQSAYIPVSFYGDNVAEGHETFNLVLVNARNAVFSGNAPALVATGTILDDDGSGAPAAGVGGFALPIYGSASASTTTPTLSVRDTLIVEGNSGYNYAYFLVTLDRPATSTVTFDYAVTDATATGAGGDFDVDSGSVTIAAGQQSAWLRVAVYGDTTIEGNEHFRLVLSGIHNAAFSGNAPVLVATGTISDNDTGAGAAGGIGNLAALVANPDSIGGAVTARVVSTTIREGGDSEYAYVYVILSQPATTAVQLDYRTVNGSAAADTDFSGTNGTLTIPAGETSGFVRVYVRTDTAIEGNEAFGVEFFNARGAYFENGLSRMSSTVVILDDDDGVADTAVMGPQFTYRSITASDGADVITGSYQADNFSGLAGNDTIYGLAGDDFIMGNAGNDSLFGGAGFDTVSYYYGRGATFDLTTGYVHDGEGGVDGVVGFEQFIGSGFYADSFTGSTGVDYFAGLGGNDFADGREGADVLNGGDGLDTVSYYYSYGAVINLAAGFAIDGTTGTGQGSQDTLMGFEQVIGSSAYRDVFTGSAGVDYFVGLGGNDYVISGGAGADILSGGDGFDTVSYFLSQGAVVNLAAGTAVDGEAGNQAGSVDTLIGFEEVYGSNTGGDVIIGDDGGNVFYGFGGVDVLVGGRGADTLFGGLGNDLFGFNAGDFVAGQWDAIGDFSQGAGNFDYLYFAGVPASELIFGEANGNTYVSTRALGGTGGFIVIGASQIDISDQLIFA